MIIGDFDGDVARLGVIWSSCEREAASGTRCIAPLGHNDRRLQRDSWLRLFTDSLDGPA